MTASQTAVLSHSIFKHKLTGKLLKEWKLQGEVLGQFLMYTSSLNIYCSYVIIVYGQKKIDFLWKQFNICHYLLYKTSIYVVINVCYFKIL